MQSEPKEGARHHGYTGARGYHPLLAVAAGTGDVLMSRLREGRAFACPATERSLIEFRHHSLTASTIESWSLPVDVAVSKSSDRDRNSTPVRCRPSITCSPWVSPWRAGQCG